MKTATATAAIILLLGALSGGCAGTQALRKQFNSQSCHSSDLDGPLTMASSADGAAFGADPLKTFSCGAPPR